MTGRRSHAACCAVFRAGVSLLAMAAGTGAVAQDAGTNQSLPPGQQSQGQQSSTENQSNANAAAPAKNDIVVIGVRRALETAQTLKKNAPTVVDSVTATDIGAFPDQSAAGAIQRIPGVSVNRLQSADDSTHPSGEPTQVLIRGLTFVRTEFNGRDSFSADSARGLQFNDVSPELLAGIDAYKNETADMIEGGIAGTVNLRTRLPFDQKGLVIAGNVKANYGSRSKKWTPEFSGLISDSWDTEAGRFGLLADFAWSHVVTRTESVIDDKIDTYCSAGSTNGTLPNGSPLAIVSNGTIPCTANPFGGSGWAFAPDGIRYSQVDYDRHRHGLALAGQYENNSGTLHATVQYLDSEYHNAWIEHASHAILDGTYFGTPAFDPRASSAFAGSTGLTFAPSGMLTGGTLTQGFGGWAGSCDSLQSSINTGSAVPGVPFVNYYPAPGCYSQRQGLYFQNESRDFDHREGTKDLSANVQWDLTPRLHADFDAQHITASTYNNDILVATGSIANYQYATNSDGTPEVTLLPGTNVNYAAGGLANPHNYWIPFIQGHVEHNNAHENAFRADLKYDFEPGTWLDSLKVGVRYADRHQTVRYSTFNWTPIAANWNCNGAGFNADNTTPDPTAACDSNFKGYGAGIFGPYNIGNLYNGSVYPNGQLVFVNNNVLTNYQQLMAGLSGAATNSPIAPGYVPICDRSGTVDGGCFLPSEIMQLRERTESAYAMLNFGGDDRTIFNGVSIVGNVGVRVVRTTEFGNGSVGFPSSDTLNNLAPCGTALGPNQVVNPSCFLTPGVTAFASGGGIPNTYEHSFTNWLPSFNVRFGLDEKDFIRFAYSKAISRPDIGLLRNYVQINAPVINTGPDSPYVVYNSPTAAHTATNVTGYNFVFLANAGNAGLKPIGANQFDLSFERYMGRSSSFTIDAFYKRLTGLISYGQFYRNFTNNGSTQLVQVNGPINGSGAGKLYGFEANYQTFFTFLPHPFDGLGVQLNYTYVHQSGINNSNVIDATSGGDVGASGAGQPALNGTGNVIDSHQLAGISKHTVNVVGLYEKGPLALRLAYNWRSRYLTQNLDCCIGLPVFQKAAGFLDGSIRYSLTKYLELSIEGTNLLGTTTVYQQEIFGDSPQTPGARPVYMDSSWSRVDRSIQLGARFKF